MLFSGMEGRFTNKLWTDAPKGMSDFQLMNTILTQARTPKEFKPDTNTLYLIGPTTKKFRVLDFGCGMGRNLVGMMEQTVWNVTGYDNSEMLDRAKKWLPTVSKKPVPLLVSDWNFIREKTFDVVVATLVFQHIYQKELSGYLDDLRKMTSKLLIHGRRWNDDGSNTWATVSRFFNLMQITKTTPKPLAIEGHPHEHLTCLGTPRN